MGFLPRLGFMASGWSGAWQSFDRGLSYADMSCRASDIAARHPILSG
jgi:hypothetical protein